MKLFQKDELKLLGPFYIEKFLSHILYFAPAFWVLQFQQHLSLFQIGILFSVLAITTFLFEIPTGAFADLFGRKTSVLFGYFMTGVSILLLYLNTNFIILIGVFALWGFAQTFTSGAKESWVIDNLKYHKKKNLIDDFFIKQQSIIGFSLVMAGFLGAYVVSIFGLNIIWLFASLSFFASFLLLSMVKEHKLTKEKKKGFRELFSQSKKSIKFAVGHKIILFLLFATFFVMFRDSFGGDLVWQPFLKGLSFPIFAFGFLFSGMTLVMAIAPIFTKPLLKKFKSKKSYLAFLILCSIILDFSVLFVNNYYLGIVLLGLMFASISLFMPIADSYFQSFIPSKMRATITSFNGMVIALAYAVSSPVAGAIADKITPQYTIVLGGIFLIPALIFYLKIGKK
ncbi:MFS transporter [archaeon]|jgi:MFS family permease|nr:MFS transporter [archaeon]MBT4373456.1 MFS transporter [archaeon]MBT4531904.1 MFS transporter [archaeon]MBT7001571.1 MFS transporter [archaeon]MBT7282537.1 MFS transporter [archaeon]